MTTTFFILVYVAGIFLLVPSVKQLVLDSNQDKLLSSRNINAATGVLSVFWPVVVALYVVMPLFQFILAPYRKRNTDDS